MFLDLEFRQRPQSKYLRSLICGIFWRKFSRLCWCEEFLTASCSRLLEQRCLSFHSVITCSICEAQLSFKIMSNFKFFLVSIYFKASAAGFLLFLKVNNWNRSLINSHYPWKINNSPTIVQFFILSSYFGCFGYCQVLYISSSDMYVLYDERSYIEFHRAPESYVR